MTRSSALFTLLPLLSSCLALPPAETFFASRSAVAEPATAESGSELQIWVPYVGQGDATLFILPNGKSLLVDAGPPGAGKQHLLPLLEDLGIQSLDVLVLSHYDSDHLGGVPEILRGKDEVAGTEDDIRIQSAYDRGGEPWDPAPAYGDYLAALEAAKVPRRSLAAGDVLALDANLRIRCVAANGTIQGDAGAPVSVDLNPPAYAGRENAASLALLLEFGDFRYLTAGDLTGGGFSNGFLTPDLESVLAEAVGEVDALHVNHHGSGSSSNESFVRTTHPLQVFIQAGVPNPYGHPHPQVLHAWAEIGAETHRTQPGENLRLTVDLSGQARLETIPQGP